MKRSADQVSKGKLRFVVILLVITGNLTLILAAMQASSLSSSLNLQATTPYPTDYYPSDKQTLEAHLRETQAVAALTPTATGTVWFFPPSTDTPYPETPPPSTPAGDGVIMDQSPLLDASMGKLLGIFPLNLWSAQVGDKDIVVYAGSAYEDSAQGEVFVSIVYVGGGELPDGGRHLTPQRAGAVHIVGAQGQRLILLSTQNETFYFDVPGEQFTTSLTSVVPTATFWPTATPWPTVLVTPTLLSDAAHQPQDIEELSPVNVPLSFILYHAGDEHWFRFHSSMPGTIQVHLDHLPANYDLYVYSLSSESYYRQSTNPGTTPELVTIENAPVDDYLVRVVGVNGAFAPNNPYQLEFDVSVMDGPSDTPTPPTATPTPTLSAADFRVKASSGVTVKATANLPEPLSKSI